MSNTVSRRGFLGLGVALGASVGLQGRGAFATQPRLSKDIRRPGAIAGDLEIAVWGGTDRADVYEQALALFETANPDVTTALQIADIDPYFERLTTQAAARDLPDLFWLNDTNFGRYATSGSLLDLTPLLGAGVDVSAVSDATVQEGTVGDGVFGLPSHYNAQAVLTNSAMLDAKGITLADGYTWDELAAAATELTDESAGVFGMADLTMDSAQRPFEVWVRQSGAELYTADGGLGFDAAVLADWFTYWQTLREAGVIPDAATQLESAGWENDLLVLGRAAIRLASASHHKVAQDVTDLPLGINLYPVTAGAADDWRFLTVLTLCIGANTGSETASGALLSFLINDIEAAKITKLSMGAPSSSAVAEGIRSELDDLEATFIDYMVAEMGKPRRAVALKPEGAAELGGALTRAAEEVAYGQSSPGDAAERVVSESSQYLES